MKADLHGVEGVYEADLHRPGQVGGQVELHHGHGGHQQRAVCPDCQTRMLENSLDEGTGKVMAKVMYMLKLLISLGSSQACVGDSPFFLSLLLEMMSGLPSLPPWLPEAHRQKFEQEVMSVSVMHSLLTMAGNQFFITFILNFFFPS